MSLLLVVEDEGKLLDSLQRGLKDQGFDVLTAGSGEEGFYLATTEPVDAVVLDVMLPGRDGFQVLRDLRRQGFGKPVLMLTARDAVEDRVFGLDEGADDYLVKPFAFAERHRPGAERLCGKPRRTPPASRRSARPGGHAVGSRP